MNNYKGNNYPMIEDEFNPDEDIVSCEIMEDENVDMELLWEDDGISDEPFIITDYYPPGHIFYGCDPNDIVYCDFDEEDLM